jgi:hypothetical protein
MEAIVPRRDDSAFEGCKKGALNFCQESDFKMRAVDDIISGESGTRRALARARFIKPDGMIDLLTLPFFSRRGCCEIREKLVKMEAAPEKWTRGASQLSAPTAHDSL